MLIDKGATVWILHSISIAILAIILTTPWLTSQRLSSRAYARLNDEDTITVVANADIFPDITWFNYVKTSKAVHFLVRFFQKTTC